IMKGHEVAVAGHVDVGLDPPAAGREPAAKRLERVLGPQRRAPAVGEAGDASGRKVGPGHGLVVRRLLVERKRLSNAEVTLAQPFRPPVATVLPRPRTRARAARP